MIFVNMVNQITFELVMLRACAEAAEASPEASLEPAVDQNSGQRMALVFCSINPYQIIVAQEQNT
ncbi:MAG: hypothetical protein IPM53_32585 [Anaerolineaceae bacterium]|nr:hypothetical protein [Anaerolineaceae bacterium]